MASTDLVPTALGHAVDFPRILPKQPDILLNSQGESHPLILQDHLTLATWPVSGILSRQVAFQTRLRDSWRGSTAKSYESAWRKLTSWCGERNINAFQVSIYTILEYLTKLFQEGKEHSTINTNRSMLSVTLPPIDGSAIGRHPLTCRFMQGIYNSRPPKPRYSFAWDVNTVISHIMPCQLMNIYLLRSSQES